MSDCNSAAECGRKYKDNCEVGELILVPHNTILQKPVSCVASNERTRMRWSRIDVEKSAQLADRPVQRL